MMAAAHQNLPKMEAFADTPTVVNVITSSPITDQKKDHEIVSSPVLNNFSPPSSPDPTDLILLDDNNILVLNDDDGYNNLVINDDAGYNNLVNNDDAGYNNLDDQARCDKAFFDSFPPGYRFCPLDSELIVHYLEKKIKGLPLPRNQIREVDLYRYNPDDLSGSYPCVGENQWYFFTPRDKKYLNGSRPSRGAGTGYWKATGADKIIKSMPNNDIVGYRKALVFYQGKPPKGKKTGWIMHEFRVLTHYKSKTSGDMRLDDYVLCKIYQKNDKSLKALQRDDHENSDNAPVQQDELRCGNGSSFDPPAIGNEQFEYPHAYQANYTHPSLGCGLQHPPFEQVHMNIQPPSMGNNIVPNIARFNTTNFTQQYLLPGPKPADSFIHPAEYPPPPTNAVDAQGYAYLKEEITLIPNPGGANIVALDNFDLPMDSSEVEHYLDLSQCSSGGFESPSIPQAPKDSAINIHSS